MKPYHFLYIAIFSLIGLGLIGCQSETTQCQPTTNPFPTPDPVEPWRNYSLPNIEVNQVCTFSGRVSRGQIYKHHITENLVFCLIPKTLFKDHENTGWEMIISDTMDGQCGDNFAPIINPPLRGNLKFDIHGWQFRNKDNTGENDADIIVSEKTREFGFLLNHKDYETELRSYRCYQWKIDCPPSGEKIDTTKIRRSVAIFTITNLKLGNLIPNSFAWIDQMDFEVKVYLSSE